MRPYACCYATLDVKVEVFEVDGDIFHMNTSVKKIYVFYLFNIFSFSAALKFYLTRYLLLAYCYCPANNSAHSKVCEPLKQKETLKFIPSFAHSSVGHRVIDVCTTCNQSIEHAVSQSASQVFVKAFCQLVNDCLCQTFSCQLWLQRQRQAICLCLWPPLVFSIYAEMNKYINIMFVFCFFFLTVTLGLTLTRLSRFSRFSLVTAQFGCP